MIITPKSSLSIYLTILFCVIYELLSSTASCFQTHVLVQSNEGQVHWQWTSMCVCLRVSWCKSWEGTRVCMCVSAQMWLCTSECAGIWVCAFECVNTCLCMCVHMSVCVGGVWTYAPQKLTPQILTY